MKISISGIDQLPEIRRLIQRAPQHAQAAGLEAVNRVTMIVKVEAAGSISDRYNLPASYVTAQFSTRLGAGDAPVAVVAARKRAVRLARFGALQLTKAAPRAKGDAKRGIAPGRKQAGVSVNVVRANGRKPMKGAFMMPLRAGKVDGGNGMGVFIREGSRLKHLYGPSPHGAFAFWANQNQKRVADRVAREWANGMQKRIRKGRA